MKTGDRIHFPPGFTLIEVVIALAIGSLVVLLAHRILAGVTDGVARIGEARAALDREANARRWLVEAFGGLDVGGEERGGPFAGRTDRVEFGTWQLVSDGWLEPRRVVLALADARFVARVRDDDTLVLAEVVETLGFDYLLEPGADAVWVREWISPVSAPLAVRMRVLRGSGKGEAGRVDTLLLIVGPRG